MTLFKIIHTIYKKLNTLHPFILLVIRLSIGLIFIQTGWGKLTHLAGTTKFFAELGIPFPHINAIAASTTEFLGGLFLIIGLLTRPAAVGLTVVMIVAIATAQWPEVMSIEGFIRLQEWDYILLLSILTITGAGSWSLDRIFSRSADAKTS